MTTRITEQKKQILAVLSERCFIECGTPPYTPSSVVHMLNLNHDKAFSVDSVRRTLKALEREGLAIAEIKQAEVLTGLGSIERPLVHYWNTETYAEDKAAAKEWNDGAADRAKVAMAQMFGTR